MYEKGAELIRMYHTLLGEELFVKGIDLYFERFDGQAVTTDDFYNAMNDASNNSKLGNEDGKYKIQKYKSERESVVTSYYGKALVDFQFLFLLPSFKPVFIVIVSYILYSKNTKTSFIF